MNANIIAVANQKGGVGKTTTCANLGIGDGKAATVLYDAKIICGLAPLLI